MAQPVVVDIGLDPVAVGALGAQRIVGHAHALADAIHQAGLMGCRVGCRVAFDGCRHGAVSWLWRNVIRQNPLLNWSYAPSSPSAAVRPEIPKAWRSPLACRGSACSMLSLAGRENLSGAFLPASPIAVQTAGSFRGSTAMLLC